MMSDESEPMRLHGCRWAWCRLSFPDKNALGDHVIFEHVRRAIPVRRKDIPMLRRAEEGLGDSLKMSDIMHDPSSSLSQRSELFKGPASSQQELPSSSLPSPPASSPVLPERDQNFSENIEQETNFIGPHPTFASLGSPAGSIASLNIPASPAFSSLIRRTDKRKEALETQQERFRKRSKLDSSQESISAPSLGSPRSVEEHLTQTSGSDDSEADEEDVSDDQTDCPRDNMMIPPTSGTPSSSPSLLVKGLHVYEEELNRDESHVISPQLESQTSLSSNQGRNMNPFRVSMSQPPSQLRLSSPLYHLHRTKSSPSQLQATQTDTNSQALSLPFNPIALASPATFAFSTPQRQTWYQSVSRQKVGSRSTSGETPPKPASQHGMTDTLPTVSKELSKSPQSASKAQDQIPATPHTIRKSIFRSGTLQVAPPSPFRQSQTPSRPQHIRTPIISNEGARNAALVTIPEEKAESWSTQSQFDQSPMSLDISSPSYPPLQTQAPYQSPSLSQ